jgi:hypothetical protein
MTSSSSPLSHKRNAASQLSLLFIGKVRQALILELLLIHQVTGRAIRAALTIQWLVAIMHRCIKLTSLQSVGLTLHFCGVVFDVCYNTMKSFLNILFANHVQLEGEIREDEMGRAYSTLWWE